MNKIKIFALFIAALALFTACKKPQDTNQGMRGQPPMVVAETVATESVANTSSFLGKVDAGSKATITARVNGYLEKRLVREGDMVKKDQLLFVIEKKQYYTGVLQAEAALSQANASAHNAELQLDRAKSLLKSSSISQSAFDNAAANAAVARANVSAAQAALEAARLNYHYTDITSPISGKIGLISFNIGETVGPASGPITSVIANEPMYVLFSVSEKQLLELRREYRVAANSELTNAAKNNALLQLVLSDGTVYKYTGTIDFTDNTISQGSDSIKLRGVFPNAEGELTQGQTVTVHLVNARKSDHVVIPRSAILSDLKGRYVLVAEADGKGATVARRDITVGAELENGRQVIDSGLAGGEFLIIEGLQKIRAGAPVTPLTREQYGEALQKMAQQAGGR